MTVSDFVQDGALGELGSELLGRLAGDSIQDANDVLACMRAGLTADDHAALVLLLGREGIERWLFDLATLYIQARQAGQEGKTSHGS